MEFGLQNVSGMMVRAAANNVLNEIRDSLLTAKDALTTCEAAWVGSVKTELTTMRNRIADLEDQWESLFRTKDEDLDTWLQGLPEWVVSAIRARLGSRLLEQFSAAGTKVPGVRVDFVAGALQKAGEEVGEKVRQAVEAALARCVPKV